MYEYVSSYVKGTSGSGVWVGVEEVSLTSKSLMEKCWLVLVLKDTRQLLNVGSLYQSVMGQVREMCDGLSEWESCNEVLVEGVEDVLKGYSSVEVELVLVGVSGNKVCCVVGGDGWVGLYRNGKLGELIRGRGEVGFVAGELVEGDLLMLVNKAFWDKFSYEKVKSVIDKRSETLEVVKGVGEVAEVLAVEVGGSSVAGGFVGVGKINLEAGWLGKFRPNLGWWQMKKKDKKQKVYLSRGRDFTKRRKRFVLGVVVMLMVMLGLSVAWGRWRSRVKEKQERLTAAVDPVERLMLQASELQGVNSLQARELLKQAGDRVENSMVEFSEKSDEYEKLVELKSRVESEYKKVSGEENVSLGVFLNLGFVREGFLGSSMSIYENSVLVLDSGSLSVVEVEMETKEAKVVAGGNGLSGVKMIVSNGDLGFGLGNEGVVEVDLKSGEVEQVIEKEEVWEDVSQVGVFGGNVYLLDRSLGELWRYRAVDDGDWVRQRWLAPGVAPEFLGVEDMFIDGSIWLVDADGGVREYVRGVSSGFGISGVDGEIRGCCVGVNSDGVFVLDTSEKAVYRFDKDGVYQKKYMWEGESVISDMVVGEGKVLLLGGDKIFEIGI